MVAKFLELASKGVRKKVSAEVELQEEPGGSGNISSVDTGGGVIARVEVSVEWLVDFGELVDESLPVLLVVARTWWLEVGVSQRGWGGEGVAMFARREEVEIASEEEKAVGRV